MFALLSQTQVYAGLMYVILCPKDSKDAIGTESKERWPFETFSLRDGLAQCLKLGEFNILSKVCGNGTKQNMIHHVESLRDELLLSQSKILSMLIKERLGQSPIIFKDLKRKNFTVAALTLLKTGQVNKKEQYMYWLSDELLKAAKEGNADLVKLICEAGGPINMQGDWYQTPLHNAIWNGHASIAEYLIREAGADVNISDEFGDTALHAAVDKDNAERVKLICDHGADIDREGEGKVTALQSASYKGNLSIVDFLLRQGADVYLGER